jgi:hypothetical protein
VLCQELWSAEYVPVTGAPAVLTPTLFSVPPAAVTVMPFEGSAALAPFPGVIRTTGPAGDGLADAAAWLAAAFPACAADPLAPACPMMVVVLPVQAATAATSAPAATADTT